MAPHARIALVTALLGAALGSCACGEHAILSGLRGDEARRCLVVLRAAGLDASVESGDGDAGTLVVRGDDADYRTALRTLEEHGLPRREAEGFSTVSSSLIPSPAEERAKYAKGLAGEVERLLESVDGVVEANVVVSVPEHRPLDPREGAEASASAVVSHLGETSPIAEEEVRAIVARAVGEAIAPERVTVLLKPVVRPAMAPPVVRYERDRVTEAGFGVAAAALASLQIATVWRMRRARLARTGGRAHADGS